MAAPIRIANTPTAETDTAEHPVTIHQFEGNWHGVTYKATQVSVSPDALIQLPSHLRPEDVEDFVAAVRAAVPVASEVKASANTQAVADPRRVFSERLQQATPSMPALPARPARAPMTQERLSRARAKRGEQ